MKASERGSDPTQRRAPRLRTVLLVVNLTILTLPLGGVALLRLYETTLLRQTEAELWAQAALIRASYRAALSEELRRSESSPESYGAPVTARLDDAGGWQPRHDGRLQPVPATLDRAADPVLPPASEARTAPFAAPRSAALAGARVTPIIQEAQRTTLAGMRVVDHRGVVVGTTGDELGMSLAHREEVSQALTGAYARVMRARSSNNPMPPLESISRGTRVRVWVAMPVVVRGRVWGAVLLSRTPMDVAKALYQLRAYIIGAAAALLLVVALLSLFTSVTIVRPVRALMRQAERVARGERGAAQPLEAPVTREVGLLSEAIARMATTLEERADYIQTFAANVSHEFKTPLTSIRGTVELLRDHLDDMTPEERARFLSNLEGDADRLGLLVTRLLELARAEVSRPGESSVELAPLLRALVSQRGAGLEVGEGQRTPSVTLEFEAEHGLGALRMAPEALTSVVGNLIDNAQQHGGQAVVVRAWRVEGSAFISVRDDGPGISVANQARIFDRFFTTARASGGSGLGLSIVKALIEAHHGDVEMTSEPGRTVFTLSLPVENASIR